MSKVAPGLDEVTGKGNWTVDLKDVNRTLSIPDEVDVEHVKESLRKVGYSAEKI